MAQKEKYNFKWVKLVVKEKLYYVINNSKKYFLIKFKILLAHGKNGPRESLTESVNTRAQEDM